MCQWYAGDRHTDTDDDKDDHDTDILGRPALPLHELASDEVTGDEGVDGGHCELLSGERRGARARQSELLIERREQNVSELLVSDIRGRKQVLCVEVISSAPVPPHGGTGGGGKVCQGDGFLRKGAN